MRFPRAFTALAIAVGLASSAQATPVALNFQIFDTAQAPFIPTFQTITGSFAGIDGVDNGSGAGGVVAADGVITRSEVTSFSVFYGAFGGIPTDLSFGIGELGQFNFDLNQLVPLTFTASRLISGPPNDFESLNVSSSIVRAQTNANTFVSTNAFRQEFSMAAVPTPGSGLLLAAALPLAGLAMRRRKTKTA